VKHNWLASYIWTQLASHILVPCSCHWTPLFVNEGAATSVNIFSTVDQLASLECTYTNDMTTAIYKTRTHSMDAGATVRWVFKAHADRLRLIQTETITWKALVRLDTPALHLITVNFHSRGRYPSFIVTILSGNLHSGIETGADTQRHWTGSWTWHSVAKGICYLHLSQELKLFSQGW